MDFSKPMTIGLSGQEVATIVTGLMELPAKHAYELIKKFETVQAAQTYEDAKEPAPPLKMVSQG